VPATKDLLIGAAVVVVAAGVAAVSHHPGGERGFVRDRDTIEQAAQRLTYEAISDAWTQFKLGNHAPLDAIRGTVPLSYLGTHEQAGTAVTLTFAAHRATCLDLISTPTGNTVRTRHC
jgi:hypothetical protein